MTPEERIEQFKRADIKRFEEAAAKYPDIKILLEDYERLKAQPNWSAEFLDGYLSCISDLIIVKKMI
jgi:hypothetical protein